MQEPKMVVKIGYYSAKQDAQTGTAIWRHEDGREVEVSVVCEPGKEPSEWFPDMAVVGPLTEFIRKGKIGEWDRK